MKILLWLDDIRNPFEDNWLVFNPIEDPSFRVIWVKSYYEFVEWITNNGLPDAICFDHDLGLDEVHINKTMSKNGLKKFRKSPEYKSGHDCAKWLVDYCLDNNKSLPLWNIQSANPVGKDNINGILNSFKKFQNA
jgi:hypothetical protein